MNDLASKQERPAAQAFLEAIQGLSTMEITWAFGMLRSATEEIIKAQEETAMRHTHFGRPEKATQALERMDFYHKVVDLCQKWRDAEMEFEIPNMVADLMKAPGMKPKTPRKKV
jgi:hypothetical protein